MEDSIVLNRKGLKQIYELQAQAEMFGMDIDWERLELMPKYIPPKSYWPSIWDDDQQMSYYYDNMNSEEWEQRHGK